MIKLFKKGFFTKVGLLNIGYISFYIGTFFLSSALPIALLFFIISICIIIYEKKGEFFLKNDLLPLYFGSFLMILGNFYSIYWSKPTELSNFDTSISWVSILNWIPLFIAYRAFQFYLRTDKNKIDFINILIAGTFPVLFSILGQIWFHWSGPYTTLGDLIVWFQKPINFENKFAIGGIAGLFSNPNYAAFWLSTIFPFSIFLFKSKSKFFEKFFSFLLICIFIYCIVLTDSRNGFLGIFIGISITLGLKLLLMILLILFLTSIIYVITKSFLPIFINQFINSFLQRGLILKLINFNILNISQINRVNIFQNVFTLIVARPFFGWLAGSFPVMFLLVDPLKKEAIQHAHNLPLQLAYDYGLITSILICSFILWLYIKSSRIIFINNKQNNNFLVSKTWMASAYIAIIFNFTDMPYYDGKIAILFWIFLAGLKTYIDQKYIEN